MCSQRAIFCSIGHGRLFGACEKKMNRITQSFHDANQKFGPKIDIVDLLCHSVTANAN